MIARAGIVACLLALASTSVTAAEITRSPRPIARPGTPPAPAPLAASRSFIATSPTPDIPAASAGATAPSARPEPRPRGLRAIFSGARKNAPPNAAIAGKAGRVCGVNAIKGSNVPPIPGRLSGCGVEAPVRITSVGGVALSTPATMDCPTAKALHTWVEKGAKPAIGRTGGGLAELKVAAGYACRTRNNQPGAKISEHGRGRAIDISAFRLVDGSQITVLDGWNRRGQSQPLRRMHKAACGPFGTVLGPNANRFHRDHFHFDTARYRSGSYCR